MDVVIHPTENLSNPAQQAGGSRYGVNSQRRASNRRKFSHICHRRAYIAPNCLRGYARDEHTHQYHKFALIGPNYTKFAGN